MWMILAAAAQPADPETVRDTMAEHWATGAALRDAVIARDLDAVRTKAGEALTAPTMPGVPADARARIAPHLKALSTAPDLDTAAQQVGKLGATCAACHQAHDATRSFAAPARATRTGSMAAHQTGAEWLWSGLVGNDDAVFDAGVLTLLESTLPAAPGGSTTREKAALALEAEVRRLAELARAAETADQRGVLFGQLMGTCARCHVLDDGGPGHAGRPVLPGEGLLTAPMHERYAHLDRARQALRRGDLDTVRDAATAILDVPPPVELVAQPWRPWSAEVRSRATALQQSGSGAEAREALADTALACGGCHAALGGGPSVPEGDDRTGAAHEAEDLLWWTLLSGRELHLADERATQLKTLWTSAP
jgi:cytochrome c2